MKNQKKSKRQNLVFAAIAAFSFLFVANSSAFAQENWKSGDEWRSQYKIGDKVQFSISGNASDFQTCIVSENSPQAAMRVKCEDFKQWSAGSYIVYGKSDIRPQTSAKTAYNNGQTENENETRNDWSSGNEWRGKFNVGDKIRFSISEKAADFQTCTVTENDPQFVMRVECDAFKHWEAGVYIVHSESNLKSSKTQSTNGNGQKNTPTKQTGGSSSGLKVGEYACYGSGGQIMAGLGFKVMSGNRYTDLDGGNAGTFAVSGDTVKFRGGHLGGQTGRELKNYNFRIGAQATCELF